MSLRLPRSEFGSLFKKLSTTLKEMSGQGQADGMDFLSSSPPPEWAATRSSASVDFYLEQRNTPDERGYRMMGSLDDSAHLDHSHADEDDGAGAFCALDGFKI